MGVQTSGYHLHEKNILNSDRSFGEILKILLKEDAKRKGKERYGAKFPVHFSYLHTLYEWFPDAKIIHLCRDPRAIYNSQLFKYYKTNRFLIANFFLRIQFLLYIVFIYKWDFNVSQKFANRSNYYLSKYEELVQNFEEKMKSICEYIDVEYLNEMKDIPVEDSSFSRENSNNGIDKSSLFRASSDPI